MIAAGHSGATARSQARTRATPSCSRLSTPVQANFPGGWDNNYAHIPTAATLDDPGSIPPG
jgi:hypothetical protein